MTSSIGSLILAVVIAIGIKIVKDELRRIANILSNKSVDDDGDGVRLIIPISEPKNQIEEKKNNVINFPTKRA